MRRGLFVPALATLLLLSSCASLPISEEAAGIGPYRSLNARLLVIEPTRRWQVMLHWQADLASAGHARLTHAASGTVLELRWQRNDIQLRDSNAPDWRKVSMQQLAEHGIVVSPYVLSRFLAGRIPAGFRQSGPNAWERRQSGGIVRIHWFPQTQRLELSDIRHGRRATLMIINGERTGAAVTPGKQPDV